MICAWRAVRLVIIAGFAAAASLLAPAPAQASCVRSPFTSPHHFTGTVTRLGNAGRTATVHTDDGRTVTVLGSEADGPNAATSVDRTYQVGVTYEFHPLNDASPYQDNVCTATHAIGAGSPGSTDPAPVGGAASGAPSTSLLLGITTAVVVLTSTVLWLLRRRANASAAVHRDEPSAAGP
jgi:hypothetical protein